MKTINVEDLPEPVALAIQSVVETLRAQLHAEPKPRERMEFPLWPGQPIGSLRRREIYDDAER